MLLHVLTLRMNLLTRKVPQSALPPFLANVLHFLKAFEFYELLKNVLPFGLKLDGLHDPGLIVRQVVDVVQKFLKVELLMHAFPHFG